MNELDDWLRRTRFAFKLWDLIIILSLLFALIKLAIYCLAVGG